MRLIDRSRRGVCLLAPALLASTVPALPAFAQPENRRSTLAVSATVVPTCSVSTEAGSQISCAGHSGRVTVTTATVIGKPPQAEGGPSVGVGVVSRSSEESGLTIVTVIF